MCVCGMIGQKMMGQDVEMSENEPEATAVRDMVTVGQATELLGLTRSGVNSAILAGTLPVVHVSPVLRLIPRTAIDEYRATHLGKRRRSKKEKDAMAGQCEMPTRQ